VLELVVYWYHSHSSLFLVMVIRWFPLSVNMNALSCIIVWLVQVYLCQYQGYIHLDVFGQGVIAVILVCISCL
jgi:hypothetical protein